MDSDRGCSPDRVGAGCTRQVSNTAGSLWSSGGVVHCKYGYFFTTQYSVLLLSSHVAAYSDRIDSPASKKIVLGYSELVGANITLGSYF